MRQLLVSTGLAPTYTNGVLSAGSVDILKKPAVGQATPFNPLLAGDNISDSDSICFVQGTAAGKNIQTPWIPARDIIRWTGSPYVAQAAQASTLTFTVNAVIAGEASIKLTTVGIGQEQHKRKNFTISVAALDTPVIIANKVLSAMSGVPVASLVAATNYPILGVDFATVSSANLALAVLVVTGTTFSSTVPSELASFSTSSENLDGSNGSLLTVTATAPSPGSGDGDLLVEFEKQLQGNVGFYNRITQPNTPVSYIAAGSNYDMYSLSFLTGPVGQIKGVDNKREIIIAYVDGGADQLIFQSKINQYLATAPGAFAAVTL